jgi:DNA-binding transcriptional ArsR family regulator
MRIVHRENTMKQAPQIDPCCDSSEHPARVSKGDVELARLAKALGHPARVQIIRFLLAQENCMCGDIVERLPLAQSTVSQHLKLLKQAGLIRGTIDGPRVCYCVEPKVLSRLRELVRSLA